MGLWTGLLVQAALFLCVKPLMVSTSQCYQILWSVVIANAVDVVNVVRARGSLDPAKDDHAMQEIVSPHFQISVRSHLRLNGLALS